VVFADIGTSVYYVPGILYGQVGRLAGLFVTLTLLVFLLLTLKYAEATVRFPEGGGEVTVASRGLSPWAGALGGMFILIDYFLTAAISSLSGLHYFSLLVPALAPYVLLITILVVLGLGVLNWWGVQESATVSAVIASLAFASDVVIVLVVLIHVPSGTIVAIFGEIFKGGELTGVTILTGYAGAFLAFSGLESIAQLAPVMRVPRRKVVSVALATVALTVGFTGPLLTIFSTILLTDPRFRDTMVSPHYAISPEPTQFISLLAGAYGGVTLAVAVAITASALLIFASNTAIIGAYHVVLALSRLRYFPRLVRRTDPIRHSPFVAIALVTLIPLVVLIVVGGNIDLLGELYGFGLLGAFSLMCISMDMIRWRERRGGAYVGALVDPELVGRERSTNDAARAMLDHRAARTSVPWTQWMQTLPVELRRPLGEIAVKLRSALLPVRATWVRVWPDVKYYLGFLTTALVLVAWLTNLIGKPLATAFGGGLTIIGLSVAALHYRYQATRYPVVFLNAPMAVPGSRLVVLSPIGNHIKAVIKDAMRQAKEYTPVFLFLAPPSHLPPPRLFEIQDRFGMDEEAQLALSRAKRACQQAGIDGVYLYAVGGAPQVFEIARRVRPSEIVAEEHAARRITRAEPKDGGLAVSPESVRYRREGDASIAHYVLHDMYAHGPYLH
jgi:amino acid transporter